MPNRRYDIVAIEPMTGLRIGIEVKTTIADYFRINEQQMKFDVQALAGKAYTANGRISGVSYVGVSFGGSVAAYFARVKLADEARKNGVTFYTKQQ
jgi:hypothetical protein